MQINGLRIDAAYDDIEAGRWKLMPAAAQIDSGEFYAQMKVPKRERDMATGNLRFRWTDTGALDHYRHAQAFDFLGSGYMIPYMSFV
jgi:hypothetical protein